MELVTLCFPLWAEWALLGWKKRGFGAGMVNGFGGKARPGETPRRTCWRETKEESGVEVDDLTFHGVIRFLFPERPEWSSECHLYIAHRIIGYPCETEEMRPQWFTKNGIPYDNMWESTILWLPDILSGKIVFRTFSFDANQRLVSEAR
jgi:8-oxo-dGTP pyrophosphatase MutT (NUDIX family)